MSNELFLDGADQFRTAMGTLCLFFYMAQHLMPGRATDDITIVWLTPYLTNDIFTFVHKLLNYPHYVAYS